MFSIGLWRLEPADPCTCSAHNGLYPRWQDHRVPVWAAAEVSEGRGPVRAQDRGGVCGQAPRHQRPARGGPGLPWPAARPALRLKPHGTTTYMLVITIYIHHFCRVNKPGCSLMLDRLPTVWWVVRSIIHGTQDAVFSVITQCQVIGELRGYGVDYVEAYVSDSLKSY